tara:strand:- start:217 stop:450 length:234 start_codon:yes stop_codon:yes gene_type:complete
VNLEFIELDLDWPYELDVCDLKSYVLSNLKNYGEPLRWAITSLTTQSGNRNQKISIEAVLIINGDQNTHINTELNCL